MPSPADPSRGIVAPAGTTPAEAAVMAAAVRAAREAAAVLHLVRAYRPTPAARQERYRRRLPAGLRLDYDDENLLDARWILDEVGDGLAPDLVVRLHLERGDLLPALCRVAQREAAGLLVAPTAASRAARRARARLEAGAPCEVRLIDPAARAAVPARRAAAAPPITLADATEVPAGG